MPRTYPQPRTLKSPPHVSLRALRTVSGLTLEQVALSVTEELHRRKVLKPGATVSRGTLSAIESGLRGASTDMLEALAVAYGLAPADIVTDYQPRPRGLEGVPA